MAHPLFIEEKSLSLADVKEHLQQMEKRDPQLNRLTQKCKEYLESFDQLPSLEKKQALQKKLTSLDLTRLKPEHMMKICDFLPQTANDLKIVLQAYPLSMPKKDQDAIVEAVKSVLG
ncbi:hypothetical protein HYX13_02515 [Candidatus Woesearchaeota archaeon]|nr:hypothetical protein [Candidatus Woesearchaeota archaeon]